jgi:hypothetical protein
VNTERVAKIDGVVQRFISNPEAFPLYRGENDTNQGGLHFTTDKDWAKNFGDVLLAGRLPARCKITLVSVSDMEAAIERGITSEGMLWIQFFSKGWDAVIGHDPMNVGVLDVIVNPIHLDRFRPMSHSQIDSACNKINPAAEP